MHLQIHAAGEPASFQGGGGGGRKQHEKVVVRNEQPTSDDATTPHRKKKYPIHGKLASYARAPVRDPM